MNPLCVTTSGHIPSRTPLSLITHGLLCGEAVEPGSSGGNYGRVRYLPPLEEYEERIKKALEAERLEREQERLKLRAELVAVELEIALKAKVERLEAEKQAELQILLLKETILRVDHELSLLNAQELDIARLAQILRDDEEFLMLIAIGVADGSI